MYALPIFLLNYVNYPIQIWKGKLRKGLLDSTLNPNLDRNRYNEVQ